MGESIKSCQEHGYILPPKLKKQASKQTKKLKLEIQFCTMQSLIERLLHLHFELVLSL